MISEIPYLDTSEFIPLTYPEKLIDNIGLLKDNIIESFYLGKDDSLLVSFMILEAEVSMLVPIYIDKIREVLDSVEDTLDSSSLGYRFEDMAFTLSTQQHKQSEIKNYDDMLSKLELMKVSLKNVILKFGTGIKKPSNKSTEVTFNIPYKMFLNDLTVNSDKYISDPTLAITLGKVIDSISILDPKDSLDPFILELENNLLSVLTSPKDFYKKCHLGEIISPIIGALFNQCYPEFYSKFLEIYLESFDKMSYQDQLNFRQCFALLEDNSQLTQLCSSNMNVIINPGNAAQGV